MTNPLRFLLLSLLAVLVSACATSSPGPSPQDVAAQHASGSFQPTAGTAGLYIFKTGVVISASDSFQINLDGKMAGLVAWNSYLYLPLAPGTHTLSSGTTQFMLSVQAGKNYFVQQKPNFDAYGQLIAPTFTLVQPQAGQQEIQSMQQASFGH